MAEEPSLPAGNRRVPLIAGAVVAVVVIAGVWFWLSMGKQSTDDAQVDGHITQLATRLGGTIVKVAVVDNQHVEAGEVVAQIDPRDYQVAVDRARAELADAEAAAAAAGTGVPIAQVSTQSDVRQATGGVDEAEAGIAVADSQVDAAKAQLASAKARVRERQAAATKDARDVERLRPLVAKEEIAQQQFDATVAAAEASRAAADAATSDVLAGETAVMVAQQRTVQARAATARARASLENANTAPQQIRAMRARASGADARVMQMRAALAQMELNLERTTIKAPSAGTVSRKSVEVGQVVQVGQPLMALVSLTDLWVVANFKETQLRDVRDGQRATIAVDALGRDFEGHVDSVAAATGAKFSLLPPENATGNYVKVVQRVPVKIVLEPGQDPEHRLRPGMSVMPTIYTK